MKQRLQIELDHSGPVMMAGQLWADPQSFWVSISPDPKEKELYLLAMKKHRWVDGGVGGRNVNWVNPF